METRKKKRVAKVIAQNVLVWISTLCLVLCVIPLHSRAAAEGYVDCSITLTKDGEAWASQTVVLKKVGSEEATVSLTEGESGTYTGELEKDTTYNLYIGDTLREENIASSEAVDRTFEYHTVRFFDDDGSDLSIPPQAVLWDTDKLIQPEAPFKEGSTFQQWMTEQGGEVPFDFNSPVSSGTTAVYASWKADSEPAVHEHTMSGDGAYKYDEFGHWQYCTAEDCPDKDKWDSSETLPEEIKDEYFAEHTENAGVLTKEPTEEAAGEMTYSCEICGYVIRTEEVPYDPEHTEHEWDDGVITEVPTTQSVGTKTYTCRVCGETKEEEIPKIEEDNIIPPATYVSSSSVPTMSLITRRVDMVDNLLTPEEKERVANGEEVQFVLEISDEAADIPAEDKAAIEGHIAGNKSLSGYHVAQYIDIDLFKVIGGDAPIPITDTIAPVTIVIEVPNVLMNAGRSFAVVWVHEGNPNYVLDADKDERTITLNTSMFSTYAIAYNGSVIGSGNNDNGDSGNDNGNDKGNENDNDNEDKNGTNNNGNTQNNNTGGSTDTGNSGADGQNNSNNSTNTPDGNANTGNQNNGSGTNGKTTGSGASPKTADTSPILLYITIAMISAMAYVVLLITDKERRMTEQEKNALLDALTHWARERGASAKLFMGFAVLCILLYYHTIGKRVKGAFREEM